MSAIDTVPGRTGRSGPSGRSAGQRSRVESIRILLHLTLLELRRSPMPLMLPLVAALFWFDGLRTGQGLPAIWTQRASIVPDHVLPDIGPIAAGMAAWIGAREQRRGMSDLAESTARPRWLRQLAAWGGTLGWTMLAYAACTAVVYVLAARVVPWGGPPLWPIAVTGLAVAAFCTTGFVAGAMFPSRFTAPLAAISTLFVSLLVYQNAVAAQSGVFLISPNDSVPPLSWGVFHPLPPDLAIVQTMFFTGLVVVLLGVLGLRSSVRGAQLRRTAVAVTLVGLAACVGGLSLAGTATRGTYGFDVPLLHDAGSDRPIGYTPDCTQNSAIPVCVQPVFSADLPKVSAAFAPLLGEVAGVPGAPARLTQVDLADLPPLDSAYEHAHFDRHGAWTAMVTSADGTPVLEYGFGDMDAFTTPDFLGAARSQAADVVLGHIVAPNGPAGAAQQAVELGLMQRVGIAAGPKTAVPAADVAAAAKRFAALPADQSHAWLIAHLDQLRSGQITLEELP